MCEYSFGDASKNIWAYPSNLPAIRYDNEVNYANISQIAKIILYNISRNLHF